MPVSIDEAKCVLVIGATSGIGPFVELLHSLSLNYPVAQSSLPLEEGRTDRELEEKNLKTLQTDVSAELGMLKETVDSLLVKYPNLDAIIFSSGIQCLHFFNKTGDLDQIVRETNVNYLSVVSLISMFIPHFMKHSAEGRHSFTISVTAGLSLMPSPCANANNFSALKAALRSFTIALRAQLTRPKINIVEIIPP